MEDNKKIVKEKYAIISAENKNALLSDLKNFSVYWAVKALRCLFAEAAQFISAKVLPRINYDGEVSAQSNK